MLTYRDFSAKPFNTVTAAAVALAKACTDAHVRLAMVISDSGAAAQLVTKYRCEPRPPSFLRYYSPKHTSSRARAGLAVTQPVTKR